jgi:hypothetical protein
VLRTHPDSQSTIGGETRRNITVFMMELVFYKHTHKTNRKETLCEISKREAALLILPFDSLDLTFELVVMFLSVVTQRQNKSKILKPLNAIIRQATHQGFGRHARSII